jgi:fluoride exporter
MLRTIILVGTGGFIGSVMRYLVQYYMEKSMMSTFPWGTLAANIAGSFIMGAVFAMADKGNILNAEWRIFLTVGICGGFTTFSAFSYNNYMMLKEQIYGSLLLNIGGNLLLGIFAVYLGVVFIRLLT